MLTMRQWQPERPNRRGSTTSTYVWAIVLIACILALILVIMAPSPAPPEIPSPPALPEMRPPAPAQFFDEHVQPAIAKADEANREAAERCLKKLHEMFDRHRGGIGPLVDDLTSWGTRFGIIRRMPVDWWKGRTDVHEMIGGKFETHLFSEHSLENEIQKAISAFRDEIEANNTTLLASVVAAVSPSDLPNVPAIEYADFAADVTRSLNDFVRDQANKNITDLLIVELASGLGGAAANQLVAAIGTRIVAMAAAGAAAGGGAAGAGAAAGAGGGLAVGPLGPVVGGAVGLIVGVAIDWWLTEHFKTQLGEQLAEMIDRIESTVIVGTDDQEGLDHALDMTCDALRGSYLQSFYDRVVGDAR